MKKQLITLLMAGLLVVGFGGSALAAGTIIDGTPINQDSNLKTQEMSTVAEFPETYTINIPSKLTLNKPLFGQVNEATFDITGDVSLKAKSKVEVSVDNVTVDLMNEDGNTKLPANLTGGTLTESNFIAKTFTVLDNGKGLDLNKETLTLTIPQAAALKTLPAGTYNGTSTFTVTSGTVTTP